MRTRTALDADARAGKAFSLCDVRTRLRLVTRSPPLTELALLSFAYAAVQVCLTSFLVVCLHEAMGWSLVASGLALTVPTIGGVVGRIVWGALADRALKPRQVLSLVGLVAGGCGLAMAFASSSWPTWIVLPITGCSGRRPSVGTASSYPNWPDWNLLSSAGAVTGAAGFLTFAGGVIGPPLFAALTALTHAYAAGYLLIATVSLVSACVLHFRTPAE